MKLKYLSLLISVAGILILYFLSELSQPPAIDIHKMPDYEGKQVIVDGIVKDHRVTKYGSQIITIENNNVTTTVFVEGITEVEYGDKIRVTGEVQKYKGGWELVINDKELLKILEKWYNISFPLWQLAENPTRYLNLNVNVTGYVESISNAFFYLVDIEQKHSLIVFYKLSGNITIFSGQKVSVSGKFSFDQENFRYQLEICEEKHGITPINSE
jgi:hypothetical protein